MNLVIAMCGIAKVFVGELIETGAPHTGPSVWSILRSQDHAVGHMFYPHQTYCNWPSSVSRRCQPLCRFQRPGRAGLAGARWAMSCTTFRSLGRHHLHRLIFTASRGPLLMMPRSHTWSGLVAYTLLSRVLRCAQRGVWPRIRATLVLCGGRTSKLRTRRSIGRDACRTAASAGACCGDNDDSISSPASTVVGQEPFARVLSLPKQCVLSQVAVSGFPCAASLLCFGELSTVSAFSVLQRDL